MGKGKVDNLLNKLVLDQMLKDLIKDKVVEYKVKEIDKEFIGFQWMQI